MDCRFFLFFLTKLMFKIAISCVICELHVEEIKECMCTYHVLLCVAVFGRKMRVSGCTNVTC